MRITLFSVTLMNLSSTYWADNLSHYRRWAKALRDRSGFLQLGAP